MEWIEHGDESTSIFHYSIKVRRMNNHVYIIHDENGKWVDNSKEVSDAF